MQIAVKTTLKFTPSFHLKLRQAADLAGQPMSEWVEEKLAPILDQQEKTRLDRVYHGLRHLQSMVKNGSSDASTTIDEFLYGGGDKEAREPGA